MKKIQQSGFAALEGLLILVIVGLIGFVGYRVYNARNTSDSLYRNSTSEASDDSALAKEPTAPEINKASDLDKAQAALTQLNLDDSNSDSSQLNSQLAAF